MRDLLAGLSGTLVGAVLGLVGGGGSILATPLLVHAVGMSSAHVAIGTSAVAVSASAMANLAGYWRAGQIKWRCGLVFAAAGVVGAVLGSALARQVDGDRLLVLFGGLMVVVGALMLARRESAGDPHVRLTRSSAAVLLPSLLATGLAAGLASGFFGIGGGFLVVPALMLATGMSAPFAVGTSLVAVTAFGAATAAGYAAVGMVDWRVAAFFIAGGVAGGFAGRALGARLSAHKGLLTGTLGVVVMMVGVFVALRSLAAAFPL